MKLAAILFLAIAPSLARAELPKFMDFHGRPQHQRVNCEFDGATAYANPIFAQNKDVKQFIETIFAKNRVVANYIASGGGYPELFLFGSLDVNSLNPVQFDRISDEKFYQYGKIVGVPFEVPFDDLVVKVDKLVLSLLPDGLHINAVGLVSFTQGKTYSNSVTDLSAALLSCK